MCCTSEKSARSIYHGDVNIDKNSWKKSLAKYEKKGSRQTQDTKCEKHQKKVTERVANNVNSLEKHSASNNTRWLTSIHVFLKSDLPKDRLLNTQKTSIYSKRHFFSSSPPKVYFGFKSNRHYRVCVFFSANCDGNKLMAMPDESWLPKLLLNIRWKLINLKRDREKLSTYKWFFIDACLHYITSTINSKENCAVRFSPSSMANDNVDVIHSQPTPRIHCAFARKSFARFFGRRVTHVIN